MVDYLEADGVHIWTLFDTPTKEIFSEKVTAVRQVRLNINIPESLLKRIQIKAAEEGTSMTKLLLPLLEKEFNE